MTHWHSIHRGLQGLVLLGVITAFLGCGSPGGEGCGGTGGRVSCLTVTNTVPQNGTTNTSNVDAFQDLCDIDDEGVATFEVFTDHDVQITFRNAVFPGASGSFDIEVLGYSISYSLNDCPTTATGCPPLQGFSAQEPFLVPAGGTVTRTFPLVPLRTKDEYVDEGGAPGPAPSYSAIYRFSTRTTPFNDSFTLESSVEFTIGNFDLCP